MLVRRHDIARHLCVVGRTLIVAAAMKRLARIALMELRQREVFARRRWRLAVMFAGHLAVGDIVCLLERCRAAGHVRMRRIMMTGRVGLRDKVVVGLRSII
jgi:hypothetical protein